jgi:hypothetical protein
VVVEDEDAAAGQAVAVVVMRAVRLPVALVLVVRIPADGFLLRMFGADSSELPAAPVDRYDCCRLDAAAWSVVAGGDGIAGLGNSTSDAHDGRETLNRFSRLARCDWLVRPRNYSTTQSDPLQVQFKNNLMGSENQ